MAKRLKSKKAPSKAAPPPRVEPKALAPEDARWFYGRLALQSLTIVLAGLWIYHPVFHGGWLMDDNAYITQNPGLRDPYGLLNIWLAPGSFVEYYPIEESLQWIQWQFWQDNASGYHVTNIILHIIGSLLVWKFFSKLGLRYAWLAGVIFAVHPTNVESVAWVAELKNTLSLPPFLIAMCFWIDYEEHGELGDYLLALGFFLIAMLCKITMAPFPFVILIYAWWKRGRITWGDVKAAMPFLIISLILGMTTIYVGDVYAPGHVLAIKVPMGDFWSRLACASISIAFYFCHFFIPLQIPQAFPQWSIDFLPLHMLPAYPQWKVNPPTLAQFLAWPIMAGIFLWCWARRRTWGKTVLLGLSFFLLSLAPFVGFHEVSYMRFTWVMDHFLYLPSLGLLGIAMAGLEQLDNQLSKAGHWVLVAVSALGVIVLTMESYDYAKTFVNLETSWTYEIKYNPDAWLAHNNLGYIMVEQNRLEEAKTQFLEALRIKPDYSEAHNNLGVVYSRLGQISPAIEQYQAALTINPDYGDAANNLDKLQNLQRMQEEQRAAAAARFESGK
jgi:tetratricopeptide (TPR) repeat protein